MAQPSSRADLINYCKRQLGAPVLEINIADEQVEDIIDDALQYFHERHFDGVIQTYLKYKITEDDINRGRARGVNNNAVGIVTTTATTTIAGTATTFSYEENSNFLEIPPAVIGINKIFRYDGSETTTNNMFVFLLSFKITASLRGIRVIRSSTVRCESLDMPCFEI